MATDWLYWLLILVFFTASFFVLYIPLPQDISDRRKLIVAEFLLRVFNEYLGDIVEHFSGAAARNKLTRYIVASGYIFKTAPPPDINQTRCRIVGVPVYTYSPSEKKSDGLIVYIHGGGWATGNAKLYHSVMHEMARNMGISAVSINYRLAPEHPFPAGLDDCAAVVRHLHEHGCEGLEFDKSKIVVIGDSAGGNLAACICHRFACNKEQFVKAQVLIYPVIHVFGFNLPSYQDYFRKYRGTALLNPKSMARWILMYLGIPASLQNIDKLIRNQHVEGDFENSDEFEKNISVQCLPEDFHADYISPSRKKVDVELAGKFAKLGTNPEVSPIFGVTPDVPPTMVITVGYDILRDEGAQYVRKLKSVGVPTTWKHFPRGFHGLFNMPNSADQTEMMNEIVKFTQSHI